MVAHLLQALKILTEPGIDVVADELTPGTILNAALSVEEPLRDAVVEGLGEDVGDLVLLGLSELTSPAREVDLSDLQDKVGEPSANTLDHSESEHSFVLAVHIRVLHSQNVSELVCVF